MKKSILIGIAAVSMLALSACAGNSTPATSASGESGAPIPITVGVIPIVDTAPLWLGKEKGFFSDEGLDLTIQLTSGGAAAVPGVVSGDYNFAFGNLVSVMVARDQGLDLRYVANGNSTAGTPDFGAVIVRGDSPITSAADLAGKTVSVNNLQNIGDTTIRQVVESDGGDSSTIKFVEVGFPDAEAAVENNQVDAAWILAPFLDSAVANGARVISYNFSAFDPDLDIAGYFTSGDTISNDPDLVTKFKTAMNKSLVYAQEHPDEVRQIVTTYTKMTADQLTDMVLPTFRVDFNVAATKKLGEAAVKFGTLKSAPDLTVMLP